ncbi:phage baseplate assembly protein V [Breznakiella homolactica]|uniref:Gp5/Type VI secretion system Vgr protein OB-fold domain-containing protein n=1 Tax=Breznakiella homolactica TaxID=2798577 RepID=A0A7T8BA60_9SPIR|nr:phage baseplate assembly protein V [Breznakiella homolactica]QQO09021.1 phage baseplate assembly protein V [Breznakiella homolactica]
MFRYREELEKLLEKYPDPRKKDTGIIEFRRKQVTKAALPKFGVVHDNQDPQYLGRIRVACDMIAPGAVTDWLPVIRMGATAETGWWQLPDIGTQCLLAFPWGCHSKPVILGFLYDQKHLPPEHSTEKAADSIVYQTTAHRMEIIDEDGKESIIISTKDGQIRYSATTDKGIEIINELGDIQIQCRKLTIEGEKEVQIAAEKNVTINGEDSLAIKSTKGTKLTSDKDITISGSSIKLNGSKGVASGGKQLAAEGDKVMGFDIHQMVIPSGSGTAVVPLPHPFIGKLADKLSDDVKVNDHNAAVKGSVAKHDNPLHMQLPGTIKFNQNPKKEGEVSNLTAAKLKINGKEAATIGSMVTTCNDMGMQNNSTVIAVGASIPMPAIINPINMDEYKKERADQETRNPEFTTVKWSKTSVKEGEELGLSAAVKDIDDGNMVTFQVWKDGQDPAAHIPYAQIPATIDGGSAKGTWQYRFVGDELPDDDSKFFFTAHSAWCPMKESGSATIELKRPKLSSPEWKDREGSTTSKGLVGEALTLSVKCNSDMEDGDGVVFRIYDTDGNQVGEVGGENQGGTAEAGWIPTKPAKDADEEHCMYHFSADAYRSKPCESSNYKAKRVIPEYTELQWHWVDGDGNEHKITKAENGAEVYFSAKIENLHDGDPIEVRIYRSGYAKEEEYTHKDILKIENQKINSNFHIKIDNEEIIGIQEDETIEYLFKIKAVGFTEWSDDSDLLEAVFCFDLHLHVKPESFDWDDEFILQSTDDSFSQSLTTKDDTETLDDILSLHYSGIIPGKNYIVKMKNKNGKERIILPESSFIDLLGAR